MAGTEKKLLNSENILENSEKIYMIFRSQNHNKQHSRCNYYKIDFFLYFRSVFI